MMMRILIAGLCLLFAAPGAVAQDGVLNVGIVLPLSGNTSSYGTETLRGANLAIENINTAGGIRGRTLNLIVRDNAEDPVKTSEQVSSIISENDVLAIIGPITSTNSASAGAVAQQRRTPIILPTATSPYVTEIGEYVFRICFTDPFQSKALAEFSRKNLKSDRVAIIYEKGSDYQEKLTEFFKMRFEGMGGAVVFAESFLHDSGNKRKLVEQALASNPDLILAPVYYPEAAEILDRVAELGSSITILGGDGWESPELFHLVEHEIRPGHVYITSHFSLEYQKQHGSEFVEDFSKAYGIPPGAVAALGYDAVMVFGDALKRATTVSREGIQEALASTHDFPGVTGTITINEKRNAIKDVYVLKVTATGFAYETVVSIR